METALPTGPRYTYEEAADELGYSLNTVTAYCSTGRINKRVAEGKSFIYEADNQDLFDTQRAYIRAREASKKARLAYKKARQVARARYAQPTP